LDYDSEEQRKKSEEILLEKEDRSIEEKLILISKDIKNQNEEAVFKNGLGINWYRLSSRLTSENLIKRVKAEKERIMKKKINIEKWAQICDVRIKVSTKNELNTITCK
jgi:hypothetical protein